MKRLAEKPWPLSFNLFSTISRRYINPSPQSQHIHLTATTLCFHRYPEVIYLIFAGINQSYLEHIMIWLDLN